MKIFTRRNYVLIKQQQLFTGLHKMNIQFNGVLLGELKLMVIEHHGAFSWILQQTNNFEHKAFLWIVKFSRSPMSLLETVVIQMRFGAFKYKLWVYLTSTETIDNGKISLNFLFLSRIILKLSRKKCHSIFRRKNLFRHCIAQKSHRNNQ